MTAALARNTIPFCGHRPLGSAGRTLGGGKEPETMAVPVPRQRETPATESAQAAQLPAAPHATTPQASLTLLVIEDDPAGGLTVPEILDADRHRIRLRTARNLTEAARLLTHDVHCILLDLSLSGTGSTSGGSRTAVVDQLDTLREVLRIAPRHAVLVLTAEADAERAAEAVRVGAQDFLFRDELDGRLLSRAIRYAVERKRADIAQYKLAESKLRAQENARLERGLLPNPSSRGRTSDSPPATAPAAAAPSSAGTSTTPSAPPTAPCTP